jgi:galactokinase
MTVARRIAQNFAEARRGVDAAFLSDLPPAAGMSSSSALMVAFFLALAEANDLAASEAYCENIHNPVELAAYLGTVENGQSFGTLEGDRGVGTFGGSEDHTAMLCAEPAHVVQYAYCPARFERSIALPAGYTFAVGSSGVVAEKTGAAREKYNRASRLAAEAAEAWRRATGRDDPHLAAALAGSPDAAARLREIVSHESAELAARLEHFIAENEQIIPAAGDALAAGEVAEFGRQVDASQHAAEQLLGNQVPETIRLAALAREHGATAASAFGAGFGGSVWALIELAAAAQFVETWAETYRAEFPQHSATSDFFHTDAGPAAFQVC